MDSVEGTYWFLGGDGDGAAGFPPELRSRLDGVDRIISGMVGGYFTLCAISSPGAGTRCASVCGGGGRGGGGKKDCD